MFFLSFFVFCEFLLNDKREAKFSQLKRSALERGIQGCRIHCHSMFNKGAVPFKCFFGVQIR
jgi:hypothetical protein